MEKYIRPEVEILNFTTEIITTSIIPGEDDGGL